MSTNSATGKSILSFLIPLAIGAIIWLHPVSDGLTPQAWHMFAIFTMTIAAILTQPLPSGAVMLIALCVVIFAKALPEAKVLSGFTSDAVQLISYAYVLSLEFVTSGLGKRIVYKMLSLFGGSNLGIAYSLRVSDLVMAPAMLSVTTRPRGIIFPVTRSISDVLGSAPGVTGKRIGDSSIIIRFQFTPITGAIFLTGVATNPLTANLAKSSLGMEVTWGGWFISTIAPTMVCFCLMPLLVYKLLDPELKRTPEAKAMGRQTLGELDSMSSDEKRATFGFVLALADRGISLITGLSVTSVGLGLTAYLFASGAVSWKSLLNDHAAWDTVIWFSITASLATGLADPGFIERMTIKLDSGIQEFGAMESFIVLRILYIYIHYLFTTATGHVAALCAPSAAAAIATGAPSMMVTICFGISNNLMWGNTEYGDGPDPVCLAQGYFERPRFCKTNLCVATANVTIIFAVGMLWWKLLGYYQPTHLFGLR